MMLLVSDLFGSSDAGIPVVNRLLADAVREAEVAGSIVSLNDPPTAAWLAEWPGSSCAGGSRARFAARAIARARAARGSLVFATHAGLVPVGRAVKHLSGGRLVLFLHGIEVWMSLPPRIRWGIRGCDLLVANSRFTLREFQRANPSLRDIPATVCYLPARHLGAPRDTASSAPRAVAPRVLVVGRLWGRGLVKGQRQLIAVWPRVREVVADAELWIVGEGDGRREFEALAASLGVAESVRFTGHVSDAELSEIYRDSSVFAMPSRGEGFGLVFAEAMAHSLPCVASRVDAGSEVVVDGETGIHVDPDDEAELLGALLALLTDPSLRRRMGEAGRRRAESLFGLASFNARVADLLRGGAPSGVST
jgi:phosphatidylinositol alpha-1,6-mannosyltransferase